MAVPPTLQSFPYSAGVQAIKECRQFATFEDFYHDLLENLPQNSPVTRKRFATSLVRWFFPERKLDGFLPSIWDTYRDDQILQDLMRFTTLEIEPVIAGFAVNIILPFAPGERFPAELARDYIISTYAEFKQDSYTRLLATVRALGFLTWHANQWMVNAIPRPANALLLLLHSRLAPTPRIVRVADLLEQPFVKYLGLRDQDAVRSVLRDATSAGLLSRYSVVDELEQVTTRYSVDDYVAQQLRL